MPSVWRAIWCGYLSIISIRSTSSSLISSVLGKRRKAICKLAGFFLLLHASHRSRLFGSVRKTSSTAVFMLYPGLKTNFTLFVRLHWSARRSFRIAKARSWQHQQRFSSSTFVSSSRNVFLGLFPPEMLGLMDFIFVLALNFRRIKRSGDCCYILPLGGQTNYRMANTRRALSALVRYTEPWE